MTVIEGLISGVVQGITEFLPISSSGHLVLLHLFLGHEESDMFFNVSLHFATLMAVIIYFRKEFSDIIRKKDIKMLFFLGIATVPAVLAALAFEGFISSFFSSAFKVGMMLIITAIVLLAGQAALNRSPEDAPGKKLTAGKAFLMGIAQAAAMLPGISRSGTTVSGGLLLGVDRAKTFMFSFLMSVPAVLGALIYKGWGEPIYFSKDDALIYLMGMTAAFITGILSLRILWWVIKSRKLFIFSIYCFLAGFLVMFAAK